MWVFAVVATDQPWPAFRDWRARQTVISWQRTPAAPDTVFLDDGQWLEVVNPGSNVRGPRSKDVPAKERNPLLTLVDWLKTSTGCQAVSAIGFGVLPHLPIRGRRGNGSCRET